MASNVSSLTLDDAYTGCVGKVTKLDVLTNVGAVLLAPTVFERKVGSHQFGGLTRFTLPSNLVTSEFPPPGESLSDTGCEVELDNAVNADVATLS